VIREEPPFVDSVAPCDSKERVAKLKRIAEPSSVVPEIDAENAYKGKEKQGPKTDQLLPLEISDSFYGTPPPTCV